MVTNFLLDSECMVHVGTKNLTTIDSVVFNAQFWALELCDTMCTATTKLQ